MAAKYEHMVFMQATDDQMYYKLLAERIYRLKKAAATGGRSRVQPTNITHNSMMQRPQQIQQPMYPQPGVHTQNPGVYASGMMNMGIASNPLVPPVGPGPKKRPSNSPAANKPPPKKAANKRQSMNVRRPSTQKKKRNFSKEELKHHFSPLIREIHDQPEADAFHRPVDPVALQIPDYFEIIKHPMDLSTIRTKLDEGQYKDPWEVCGDVRLMWQNAWKYNRKASRIYKYTTKLSELFEAKVNPIMTRLGFCCGKLRHFTPAVLHCNGKPTCTVARDSKYKCLEKDVSTPQVYCLACFKDITSNTITLGQEENGKVVDKKDFVEKCNNELKEEPKVTCTDCGRQHHEICELWHKRLAKKFVCSDCRKTSKRQDTKHSAKKLPQTELGNYMQKKVRKLLKDKNQDIEVTVRVVCIRNKTIPVSETLTKHYSETDNKFPEQFEYRHKALFVYQKQDDVDLCFFGMHVQEYNSDTPAPNRGRVYISYLDSVHYFKPKNLRTEVYHELLMAYMEYCKNIGYSYAHIWACPPSFGDDYIFHCHPTEQKVPKPKRLQEWYKVMLAKAKERKVVHNWLDMTEWVKEEKIAYARQFPYFEGDFWPGMIEDVFKELKAEEAEENKSGKGGKASKKGKKNKKGNKKGKGKGGGKKGKNSLVMHQEELADRLLTTLEKLKDTFFVVYLQPPPAPGAAPRKIKDKDGDMTCELMDGRDGFLNLCRDNNLEFSQLRRAKHSSMVMLYTLHVAESDFNYTCNGCDNQIAAMDYRWHCDHKDCGGDYDLCEACYKKSGHEHEMKKLGFGVGTQEGDTGKTQAELKRLHIQRCIDSLVHACQCTDTSNCKDQSCAKMKQVVKHTRECPSRTDPKKPCHICKQLVALCCYHAKHCKTGKCQVPFCQSIKDRLKKQQLAQRARELYRNRRRQHEILNVNNTTASTPGVNPGLKPHLSNQIQPHPSPSPMVGRSNLSTVRPNPGAQTFGQQQMNQQRPQLSNVSPTERLQIVNHNIKMCRDYLSAMEKRNQDRLRAGAQPPNPAEVAKEQKSVNEVKAKLVQLERARNQLRAPTPKQKEMLQQMINQLRQLPHAQQLQTIRSYDPERAQLFKWYQQHTHNQKMQQHKMNQVRQQQMRQHRQSVGMASTMQQPGVGNPVAPNIMAMHGNNQQHLQSQQQMQAQQMQNASMQRSMSHSGMQNMQALGMQQQLTPQQRVQMQQQRMMGAQAQQGGDLLGNLADRLVRFKSSNIVLSFVYLPIMLNRHIFFVNVSVVCALCLSIP